MLVCEDADDARYLLAEMLRSYGFEVTEAADGSEAIELVTAGAIDVALIDIGLPDVNGFEVARRIRESSAAKGVRLIAVTGYGTAADRESARLSGFDFHLLKPVTIEQLLYVIGATSPCDSPSG
ncbi:MAG: response regulator [Kofleriaceae bacterium]